MGKAKMDYTLKYIDPTYMVRAVPANASDNVYCTVLAQSAVHGAMAGLTGFTVRFHPLQDPLRTSLQPGPLLLASL
eukprot:4305672-Pyramimonas_sp.AAC.1